MKGRMEAIYAEYEARQIKFDAREHREGGPVEGLIDEAGGGRLTALLGRSAAVAVSGILRFRLGGLQRELDQHRQVVEPTASSVPTEWTTTSPLVNTRSIGRPAKRRNSGSSR